MNLSSVLMTTMLSLTGPLAHAETTLQNPLLSERLGGVVVNSNNGEKIYLSCVEKNDRDQCVQYRFVDDLGSQARMIGSQEIEPFNYSSVKVFQPKNSFDFKKLPTLSWMGEGFHDFYKDWELNNRDGSNAMFATPIPVVGLPGVGAPVLIGCFVYDMTRLAILTPPSLLASIGRHIRVHRLNRAFWLLFNNGKRNDSIALNAERFEVFKNQLVRLSTPTTPAKN